MNLDETLAEALHRTADQVTIGPSPIDDTVRRGLRTRRRRRTTGVALGLVMTAAALPVWSLLAPSGGTTDRGATPAVQVAPETLPPGQATTLPSGTRVWLTEQGVSALGAGAPASAVQFTGPSSDAAQAPITASSHSDGAATVWIGVYKGPGTPARITLDFSGRLLPTTVLTLPNAPGWTAFAAEDPDSGSAATKPYVSVYAADGSVLCRTRL